MREIKFRAWDKEGFIKWLDLGYDERTPVFFQCMYYNVEHCYDCCESEQSPTSNSFGNLLNNDRFTIMQYTGLKDVNGKEIYEGDIVTRVGKDYVELEPCEVKYQAPYFFPYGWGMTGFMEGEYKVLGNVYENPKSL